MRFITAVTTSIAFTSLAACTDNSDLAVRDWAQPVSPEALNKRQGSEKVVQIVQVGDNSGSLKFFPEKIVAEVGSVVQFQFYPKVCLCMNYSQVYSLLTSTYRIIPLQNRRSLLHVYPSPQISQRHNDLVSDQASCLSALIHNSVRSTT